MSAASDRSEGAVLVEVMQALRKHPAVAWCERQNTGSARIGGRFVRFGWPGCADVLGQLHDGRFLAVECKSATGKLRPEQVEFLERIRASGGVGFMARDCRDVQRELHPPRFTQPLSIGATRRPVTAHEICKHPRDCATAGLTTDRRSL